MHSFCHSGDFGDLIYSLPILKHWHCKTDEPTTLYLKQSYFTRHPMTAEHAQKITPLLKLQPYIADVKIWDGEECIEGDEWRFTYELYKNLITKHGIKQIYDALAKVNENYCSVRDSIITKSEYALYKDQFDAVISQMVEQAKAQVKDIIKQIKEFCMVQISLPGVQAAQHGLKSDIFQDAWLFNIEPKRIAPVVLHRSERVHGTLDYTPYLNNAVFIGFEEEHEAFQQKWGKVYFYKTKDLLEIAEVIAGCDLYVANQSSPFAVAMGLNKDAILEEPSIAYCRNNHLGRKNVLII